MDGFKVKVVKDSFCLDSGVRLTSLEIRYPRFIHSELMTHRMLAKNSASSRAIPWKKIRALTQEELDNGSKYADNCMYQMIRTNPVIPISFGREQSGMQSGSELFGKELEEARNIWLDACDAAIEYADRLSRLGVHKSIVNRLIEPFMWITVLVSGTDWNNFFRLRIHKDAEKHFQKLASMMKEEMDLSEKEGKVEKLVAGQWHCPYLFGEELEELRETERRNIALGGWSEYLQEQIIKFKKISVGRCARLSYLTHDGKRDVEKDIDLCNKLAYPSDVNVMHASPFEHVACGAASKKERSGCFHGWKQYRKEFSHENVPG